LTVSPEWIYTDRSSDRSIQSVNSTSERARKAETILFRLLSIKIKRRKMSLFSIVRMAATLVTTLRSLRTKLVQRRGLWSQLTKSNTWSRINLNRKLFSHSLRKLELWFNSSNKELKIYLKMQVYCSSKSHQ
jgi:hypothetical protein